MVEEQWAAPVPGRQRAQVGDLVIGDASQHVGEPGLGIDIVELGGLDQCQDECGALAAAIGAGEQPGLAAKRNPAQLALGRIIAQADAAVLEETRRRRRV